MRYCIPANGSGVLIACGADSETYAWKRIAQFADFEQIPQDY